MEEKARIQFYVQRRQFFGKILKDTRRVQNHISYG